MKRLDLIIEVGYVSEVIANGETRSGATNAFASVNTKGR